MITRCPECGTKFRISVDLVRAEDSSVRCGDCMSVFDARSQLVDEAAESSYLVDSARERAARLRHDQHQASQSRARSADAGATGGREYYNEGHGAGWVNPDWESDHPQQNPATGQTADNNRPRPDGHLLIDRRESEADIDLENADTIAFQPLTQHAGESKEPQIRARQSAPDLELEGAHQAGFNPAQLNPTEQYLAELNPVVQNPAELNLAEQRIGESPVLDDYSRRIDPLINPDDKAIEFERTLALEGLTGIESDYPEQRQSVRQRTAVEKSIETVTQAENTSRADSYVGEHQFDSPAPVGDAGYDPESRMPQTRLRTRVDFKNDPDIVNRPVGPPRSERHLADAHRSSYHQPDVVGHDRASEYGPTYNEGYAADQSEHYSLDQPHESRDTSDSALSMREHLNERSVAIDTDDDYEHLPETRSNSLGWVLVVLLAAVCAAAFYARDDIAKSNLPQPVRAAFCSVTGCQLPVASNTSDLELLRQKVYSHPSIEGALVVSIDIINNAVFPQPYPILSVTMANGVGESVAQRDFIPEDYLESYTGNETLAAGKPTRINIDIVDPGADAQSFEMEFRQQ